MTGKCSLCLGKKEIDVGCGQKNPCPRCQADKHDQWLLEAKREELDNWNERQMQYQAGILDFNFNFSDLPQEMQSLFAPVQPLPKMKPEDMKPWRKKDSEVTSGLIEKKPAFSTVEEYDTMAKQPKVPYEVFMLIQKNREGQPIGVEKTYDDRFFFTKEEAEECLREEIDPDIAKCFKVTRAHIVLFLDEE